MERIGGYNNSSAQDMAELVRDLESLKEVSTVGIPAIITVALNQKIIEAPFALQTRFKILHAFYSPANARRHFAIFLERSPVECALLWKQLTNHICYGKSNDDPNAAGGLNWKEVNHLVDFARKIGWNPSVDRDLELVEPHSDKPESVGPESVGLDQTPTFKR